VKVFVFSLYRHRKRDEKEKKKKKKMEKELLGKLKPFWLWKPCEFCVNLVMEFTFFL
jgi:hypothetical protein